MVSLLLRHDVNMRHHDAILTNQHGRWIGHCLMMSWKLGFVVDSTFDQ